MTASRMSAALSEIIFAGERITKVEGSGYHGGLSRRLQHAEGGHPGGLW